MRTIWKWTLAVTDRQFIGMRQGAQILTVQMQGGQPQLWALCDPNEPLETREIAIYGTGHDVPDAPGRYISTLQMADGALVWHVFEPVPQPESPR